MAASSGAKLNKEIAEGSHTVVAKGLFVCKRARPDIQPTIAVLCSRVKEPQQSDWSKLIHMLKYLNGKREDVLILSADNLQSIKWWVDASFAVHPDFKSHTGAVMLMGWGTIQSLSQKQKLNTRSSTEAELVGADDATGKILWTRLFLESQGYPIVDNVLHQDNQSMMKLESVVRLVLPSTLVLLTYDISFSQIKLRKVFFGSNIVLLERWLQIL